MAQDNDPQRVTKLARVRLIVEQWLPTEALFFADKLDCQLLPKIGYKWMPKGTHPEVMTPGTNQKRSLAGALNYLSGKMLYVLGERKNWWLFLDLLKTIEARCPAAKYTRVYAVVNH